ncbi:CLUMA_CG021490, isoform A [Clunio marinus]|uniref:CLUMA_CG021490, isoform A n=1 Tax=Clunio marinus TaxID=568069 RepID=A0A1J1J833_9DIPT|nr:CLUMA_CG021490, isoform A [Clunio marinus]
MSEIRQRELRTLFLHVKDTLVEIILAISAMNNHMRKILLACYPFSATDFTCKKTLKLLLTFLFHNRFRYVCCVLKLAGNRKASKASKLRGENDTSDTN